LQVALVESRQSLYQADFQTKGTFLFVSKPMDLETSQSKFSPGSIPLREPKNLKGTAQ